jgi:hypothetical protein
VIVNEGAQVLRPGGVFSYATSVRESALLCFAAYAELGVLFL